MAHDREVAGIRCMQVLELLPDYLEEELSEAQGRQIQAHLASCDWCERFGQEYASTVALLRGSASGELPPEVKEKLSRSLEELP